VARLLQWLAVNPDDAGKDAALDTLQRNAAWLSFLMVPSTQEDKSVCDPQASPHFYLMIPTQ
jgi:DEAD/DEAH box helicase domain-containing protein